MNKAQQSRNNTIKNIPHLFMELEDIYSRILKAEEDGNFYLRIYLSKNEFKCNIGDIIECLRKEGYMVELGLNDNSDDYYTISW